MDASTYSSAYSTGQPHDNHEAFRRSMRDLLNAVEVEFRQTVAYVDKVIVPEVRRETGTAARVLARHLNRVADHLHPLDPQDGKQGL
jgi:hypothetical protein